MIVWFTIEASCPMCSMRLRLRELGGGVASGQHTDLLVRMEGKHLIQAEVHSCQKCRFAGYAADFLRTVPAEARRRFLDEISLTLREPAASLQGALVPGSARPRTPLPDIQHYWAYRSAQALGLDAHEQGQRLMRAYWCCRLAPTSSLSPEILGPLKKAYLRGAIQKLRQGLGDEHDRSWLYVIGELCRRNGNFLLAVRYFRRFLDAEPGTGYLTLAAGKLIELCQRRQADDLTMEELLYDRTPDRRGPAERPE
jgi:hypothetical protein